MPGTVETFNRAARPAIPVTAGLFDGEDDDLAVIRIGYVDAGAVTTHRHAIAVPRELDRLRHLVGVDVDHGHQALPRRDLQTMADIELTVIRVQDDCVGFARDVDPFG
jgi:hypothetical protein